MRLWQRAPWARSRAGPVHAGAARAGQVTGRAGDAADFETDMSQLGDRAPAVRALLTALAWGRGPGLPRHGIWVPVARALAAGTGQSNGPVTGKDVRFLLR
ncbi:MAG TPA: hypothetical protein VGS19_05750, partial [Streptosporangiaceae bacterium]|nr:hypothetical protein [Streptosporangiaceae bacterium]